MSSIWVRSLKATPKFDCGLCGFQRCASFTRAAVTEDISIDACPVLSQDEFGGFYGELESVLKRGATLRSRTSPEMPDGGLLLTKPCKDTDEKVMAELRAYNGVPPGGEIKYGVFDSVLLCDFLDCLSTQFDLVKCSRDLGYGRADTGDMSITILQDGRINMRRVDDTEHVIQVFKTIENAILGSIVCNCCGNDLISILMNPDERMKQHTVYDAGSRITINKEIAKQPLSKSAYLEATNDSDSITSIETSCTQIVHLISEIADGKKIEILDSTSIEQLRCRLVTLASHAKTDIIVTHILKLIGLLWVIESALIAVGEIALLIERVPPSLKQDAITIVRELSETKNAVKPSIENELIFQLYAHGKRIERLFKLYIEWVG
ncbi:MAG: (Fe-S)-binding protein [Candidatus Thorarchaeota archaeon]